MSDQLENCPCGKSVYWFNLAAPDSDPLWQIDHKPNQSCLWVRSFRGYDKLPLSNRWNTRSGEDKARIHAVKDFSTKKLDNRTHDYRHLVDSYIEEYIKKPKGIE